MRLLVILVYTISIVACSRDRVQEEQISALEEPTPFNPEDTLNSVKNSLPLSAIVTYPQKVVLTGLPQHRLVSVYKQIPKEGKKNRATDWSNYYNDRDGWESEEYQHYMPGLDLLFGYNLLNLAHYDMKSEQLNYLFNRPVLVKSVYYPSVKPDSVGKKPNRKPINRDYFFVSAFDEDTNNDTLINRHDLRRFYHFNASCDVKTQVIPPDYNVIRSQYDSGNDVMYIFARHDQNKNGKSEDREPVHVFWIDLKAAATAKRLY